VIYKKLKQYGTESMKTDEIIPRLN